ncbi:hypothetical protein GF376_03650 [Candidatus Peregrinibacteria bacterium]|nr:hypothetical protein [Candidatus Peregrinibacteria bacterium]
MSFIQFIADYGKNDPSFAEVMQRLVLEVPGVLVKDTSVHPFSTIETGFWTAQFALAPAPGGTIVYTNCAPRKDKSEARKDNEGEKLVYAILDNGVEVVGVNAGYCFSFVKNHIDELWDVDVKNSGSQFRSRDFYPEIVGKIYKGNYSFKKGELDKKIIPDYPKDQIVAIDGYGNIKTAYKKNVVEGLEPGKTLKVKIGGQVHTAYFADGTFSVGEGELAFAEGSSGYDGAFMELFLRGASAERRFDFPKPGDQVELIF